MPPLISIIIPVYNVESFLHSCLDSIQNQTFDNWEAILVDDGGKDKSGIICDEYCNRDNRFRVFHRANHGVSASRNFGIQQARGTYLCFVDSDDYIHHHMLEILFQNINNSNYDVIMSQEEDVYDTDSSRAAEKQNSDNSVKEVTAKEFFYGVTHSEGKDKNLYFHLHGKLYRKEAVDGILLDEDLSLSEDMLFNVKVFSRGVKALLVPVTMYFRTMLRQDSLSVNVKDTLRLNTNVFLRALDCVPKQYRFMFLEHIIQRVVSLRGRDLFAKKGDDYIYKALVKEYRSCTAIPLMAKIKQLFLYHIPVITYVKIRLSKRIRSN